MSVFVKKIWLIITVVCISNFGFSQSSEITIKFIANCGLYMTDGAFHFYIDFPYKPNAYKWLNPRLNFKYDPSEIDSIKGEAIFIFTHQHDDHYSRKLLKKFDGKKHTPKNISKLEELNNTIPDFNIKAFKTDHKILGFPVKHYSYFITWHDKKFFISGDTGNLEDVSKLKDIDWAFINHWMYRNAYEKKVNIDTKMFGIYHIPPNAKIVGKFPDNVLLLIIKGEVIRVPFI